jgi:hypothetical protein
MRSPGPRVLAVLVRMTPRLRPLHNCGCPIAGDLTATRGRCCLAAASCVSRQAPRCQPHMRLGHDINTCTNVASRGTHTGGAQQAGVTHATGSAHCFLIVSGTVGREPGVPPVGRPRGTRVGVVVVVLRPKLEALPFSLLLNPMQSTPLMHPSCSAVSTS